eukprot:10694454-Prorocentrum_lima.AAC.1
MPAGPPLPLGRPHCLVRGRSSSAASPLLDGLGSFLLHTTDGVDIQPRRRARSVFAGAQTCTPH